MPKRECVCECIQVCDRFSFLRVTNVSVGDCVVGKPKANLMNASRDHTVVAAIQRTWARESARSFNTVASHETGTQDQSSVALHILLLWFAVYYFCTRRKHSFLSFVREYRIRDCQWCN